mmetsp:Transcript_25303/g.30923  ORF Transcript_25303/g.30923 Transcript_25303/m.30923 type:complete len:495 (+) Transcript_25303:1706-3190(+)|eukprot:CAMPEP_0204826592 /NCGR_PEP_ID=MMETSP1346-20131115/4248_1 /ASSEMBLY_ACC=CAM_ASM_000771 /TAXON_ID=215587 /ORGANISM="Aplanochytrium stocchinoi, Strain GSBS06" /LENGTH=494 /DNA_ID=CAMNT_0051954685 /DNA_START=437 /DNA_END=1921 /DNA_ORIENTATION=+
MMEDIFETHTATAEGSGKSKEKSGTEKEESQSEYRSVDPNASASDKINFDKLQKELERLKDTLRLYEEPPDLDEQRQTLVVDGFKTVKTNYLGSLHVRYQITRTRNQNTRLSVYRRFSDWIFLHSLLMKSNELHAKIIPSPPPKKSIGNTDLDFVELRMLQLHAFTKALTGHPDIRKNEYFRKFLYLTNEQWEEITGTVTAVTSLPDHEDSNDSSNNYVFEGDNNKKNMEGMTRFFKNLGKTGKSLIYKTIGKDTSPDSFLLELNKDITDLSPHEFEFVTAYRDLTVAFVNNGILQSYGSKHYLSLKRNMNIDAGDVEQTPVLLSNIYEKAVTSLVKIIKLIKSSIKYDSDLATDLQKLALQEGTASVSVGPSMFNNLVAFANTLEEVARIELECYRSMTEKHGDADANELVIGLYQNLFALQGASVFFKRYKKLKTNDIEDLARRKDEVKMCEKNLRSSLQNSLESYAQQQIQCASQKVKAFKGLYATLCQEN